MKDFLIKKNFVKIKQWKNDWLLQKGKTKSLIECTKMWTWIRVKASHNKKVGKCLLCDNFSALEKKVFPGYLSQFEGRKKSYSCYLLKYAIYYF